MTFAVKDLSLDLRAHVDVRGSEVRIRPAGPGDGESSVLHLGLTTITKPMMEENTDPKLAHDEPSLDEVLGDKLTSDEKRRLEWAGVHNMSQLRELSRNTGEGAIERVAAIPVMRLRAALARAAEPRINRISPERLDGGGKLLRIRGDNFMTDQSPEVKINGAPVAVLQASDRELLVAPLSHQLSGTLSIETSEGTFAEADFDVPPPPPAAPAQNGHSQANGGTS